MSSLCGFLVFGKGWSSDLKEDEERPNQTPKHLVLSLDGGGIRGILEATILQYWEDSLETALTKHYPNAPKPDIRLGDVFDLIAGTSTGGIIGILMRFIDPETGRPKFKMGEILSLYKDKGTIIFPSKSFLSGVFGNKYSPEPLEKLINQYVGDAWLTDLNKPTLITSYDVHQEGLFLFKSHESKSPAHNFQLSGVARATSAAPTYFPTIILKNEKGTEYEFSDGGIAVNNPTCHAYLEAQKLYPQSTFDVISLGTGTSYSLTLEQKSRGGKLKWVADISAVLMNNSSSVLEGLTAQATALRGDTYTRVHFDLDKKANAMDSATPGNIHILEGYAKREKENDKSPVNAIKDRLIDFYRHRQFYVFYPLIEDIQKQLETTPGVLDLKNCYLTERKLWEVVHFLTREQISIGSLDLSYNQLPLSSLQYIKDLNHLQSLQMNDTGLTLEGLQTLKGHNFSLKYFSAVHNPFSDELENKDIALLAHFLETYDELSLEAPLHLRLGKHYESLKQFDRVIQCYQHENSSVQKALAELYLRDDKQISDFEKGFQILNDLINKGDVESQYLLGHFYDRPAPDLLSYMRDSGLLKSPEDNQVQVKKELFDKKVHYYKLAAEQGHKIASKMLGDLYNKGEIRVPIPHGAFKDERHQLKETLKWYRLAQSAGSTSVGQKIATIKTRLKGLEKH